MTSQVARAALGSVERTCLPREEKARRGLIQDTHRSCAEAVELREFPACENLCPCRLKVPRSHDILEQMPGFRPVSFNRGGTFIHPAVSQGTSRNHARGFYARGLPERLKHPAMQVEPRFAFFGTTLEIDAE